MIDLDAPTGGGWTIRQGVRLGFVIPLALFGFPMLAIFAYVLFYFSPALAGPCEGIGCGPPHQRTYWILAALTAVPAAVCLVLSVRWVRSARRWWPLPLAVVALATASGWAVDHL